jgi:serine/threonine-protein kinase
MPASVSRVIITDFGLARTADDASLTRSGVLAGTPQYMSPEQAKGELIDGRTDLFSLGSVMYAMACGRPPFRAESPYGVLRKITDDPHRPLSQVRDDTPAWFEKTVDRLLAKQPNDRFQSATELADFLEETLAHLRQPTTTLLPKLESTPKQKRNWAAAIAVLLVCGALIAYGVSLIPSPSNTPASNRQESVESSVEEAFVDSSDTSNLGWEFDDLQLNQLENELDLLLRDTANVPFAELRQPSE